MSGQNGQPNQGDQTNGKYTIISALISGICVVMSSIIGIFSYNLNESNKTLTVENISLTAQNNDWETSYNELQKMFNELDNKNTSLSSELNSLRSNLDQYSSIVAENNTLKAQIFELKNQLQLLNDSIENQENEIISTSDADVNNISKKVSIFDLDPFQGKAYWFKDINPPFSDEKDWLTDMYGTAFHTGYIAYHGAEKQEVDSVYFIDKKYSKCNVMMAWPRGGKNLINASAYIKFYSDDQLLYTSPEIKCGDKPIEFSFDVSNVEKFSFELISIGNNNPWMSVVIIYPYFDLVE